MSVLVCLCPGFAGAQAPADAAQPATADEPAEPDVQPAQEELLALPGLSQRQAPRALLGDEAVIPGYWEVGSSVTFASAAGNMDRLAKPVPDTVRLGLSARLSLGDALELSGGLLLPPKQSTVTDDPPLFGGGLMGRYALSQRQSLYLSAGAERTLQIAAVRDDAAWAEAAVGWDGRSFMDKAQRWIAFSWNLGLGTGRSLGAEIADQPWLVEAIAGIGLTGTFAIDEWGVGFTLGSDFRFPVLSGGSSYWTAEMPELNPQTRADLYTTLFISLATGWNVTATLAYRDRGNSENPETIIPALEGGFDATAFTVGFAYSGVRQRGGEGPRFIAE